MGGSGTGGWELLARQVKQSQRQLEAMAFRRAAMRQAAKDVRLRGQGIYDAPPAKAEFSCHSLCLECGYLSDRPTDDHSRCPACNEPSLVDLSYDETMEFVHELDVKRRTHPPRGIKLLLPLLYLVVTISGIYILLESDGPLYTDHFEEVATYWLLFSLVMVFPAYALLKKPLSRLVRRVKPLRKARWRLPLPARKAGRIAGALADQGEVAATCGQLTSPILGEPCVAYRVRVYLRDPESTCARELILDESAGNDFQVGEALVDGRTVLVELPLRAHGMELLRTRRAAIERFFRERGLVLHDGRLEFLEACVKEGDFVTLRKTAGGTLSVIEKPRTGMARGRIGPYR